MRESVTFAGSPEDFLPVDPEVFHPIGKKFPIFHNDNRRAVDPVVETLKFLFRKRKPDIDRKKCSDREDRLNEGVMTEKRTVGYFSGDQKKNQIEAGEFGKRAAAGGSQKNQKEEVNQNNADNRVHEKMILRINEMGDFYAADSFDPVIGGNSTGAMRIENQRNRGSFSGRDGEGKESSAVLAFRFLRSEERR